MALIARGELLPLLESFTPQQMGIHAIYTSRQHMPAALRAMLDFLADWFRHDAGWLAHTPAPSGRGRAASRAPDSRGKLRIMKTFRPFQRMAMPFTHLMPH
jgi:hypothetical protein